MVILDEKESRVSTFKDSNDRKKEYLRKYRESVRMIKRIESELTELRAMKAGTAINYDGMPSGTRQSDLSDYAAELDYLERKLVHERYKRIDRYQDIERRIKDLESQNESDVLFYRYIKGLDWWEVAEKMGYSERHITRLHGKALAHFELPKFELPKDVLECPTRM